MSGPDDCICLADPEPSCPQHGRQLACTCPPGAHGPVPGCRVHWFAAVGALADALPTADAATEAACDRLVAAQYKPGVPLVRATELDALRAQLATAERERDEARTERDRARTSAEYYSHCVDGWKRMEAEACAREMAVWEGRREAEDERDRLRRAADGHAREMVAAVRGTLADLDDARALLAAALRCGLDEAERLREERGTLLDAHVEERDVWEASRACDLVAERDAAVSERDAERLRAARLRAALAWAAKRCEQGYDAAYVGRELRGVLAADDAAGGTDAGTPPLSEVPLSLLLRLAWHLDNDALGDSPPRTATDATWAFVALRPGLGMRVYWPDAGPWRDVTLADVRGELRRRSASPRGTTGEVR